MGALAPLTDNQVWETRSTREVHYLVWQEGYQIPQPRLIRDVAVLWRVGGLKDGAVLSEAGKRRRRRREVRGETRMNYVCAARELGMKAGRG
jgi:hypothetical protein